MASWIRRRLWIGLLAGLSGCDQEVTVQSESVPCVEQAPCDDGDPCTSEDTCAHGVCRGVSLPDGTVCNAPDCTGLLWQEGRCAAGTCQLSVLDDCDDGEPCTDDVCDAIVGCSHTPRTDDTPCGEVRCDGLSRRQRTCQSATCTDRLLDACDDGNPCTDDACDITTGCSHSARANGASCGGRTCSGLSWQELQCQAGDCVTIILDDCDDANPCTGDECSALGCTHVVLANGSVCGASACAGTCSDGACFAGTAGSCNDATACTFDLCAPEDACYNGDVPLGVNVIRNPGFNTSNAEWTWCSDPGCGGTAGGTVVVDNVAGLDGNALRLEVTTVDEPMQIFQPGILLEPNSSYRILITGSSPTDAALSVQVIEHTSPFGLYGPASGQAVITLTSSWATHELTFSTSSFSCETNARLRMILSSPVIGDVYLLDHVALIRE